MARVNALQYREGAVENFGRLRIIHLGDLLTVETQVTIADKALVYGMRLGWKRAAPPLTGELVSLHLPQSKLLVRVTKVTRTCLCCARGIVYLHVEQVPGIIADPRVCDCAVKRPMETVGKWRDIAGEVACPRKNRAMLANVAEIIRRKAAAK